MEARGEERNGKMTIFSLIRCEMDFDGLDTAPFFRFNLKIELFNPVDRYSTKKAVQFNSV